MVSAQSFADVRIDGFDAHIAELVLIRRSFFPFYRIVKASSFNKMTGSIAKLCSAGC